MKNFTWLKTSKVFFLTLAVALLPATAKIKVAASLTDLASITSYIGGDQVEVFAVAKANSNPHFVEVLPSYMIRVSRVAIYLKVGLGLDPWADPIIEGARNNAITVVDCSQGIDVLEKPTGKVDASQGDVHQHGNPHYWLDPANGIIIADHIKAALSKADPDHAAMFEANANKFKEESAMKIKAWKAKMSGLQGTPIVTYHSSWVYLAKAYKLRIIGYVEPLPGIPPTARHLQALQEKIRAEKARILIQEPYYGDSDAKFLGRNTGILLYRFTPSCVGTGKDEYFRHFDAMVNALSSKAG